jgi:hypothetical protein
MTARVALLHGPALAALPRRQLVRMLEAGETVIAARDRLLAAGGNVVAAVLRGQGAFYEFNHYPEGDVYDPTTGAQYYYHAHRSVTGEHGHFHTFVRRSPTAGAASLPTHLIAISIDEYGEPRALFAVNRWVTDEAWLPATGAIRLLPRFAIRLSAPDATANAWITGMLQLYRPDIETLLRHRDSVIDAAAAGRPRDRALDDHAIEMTGSLAVDVEARVEALRHLIRAPATRLAGFRKG